MLGVINDNRVKHFTQTIRYTFYGYGGQDINKHIYKYVLKEKKMQ